MCLSNYVCMRGDGNESRTGLGVMMGVNLGISVSASMSLLVIVDITVCV